MGARLAATVRSDDADQLVGWAILILLGIAAVIWCSSRIFVAAERKGADTANCVASSSSPSADTDASQTSTCSSDNSSGHNYSYGRSVSSANDSGSGGSGGGVSSYSASWTGAAGASSSVLRRNGADIALNNATNPDPIGTQGYDTANNATMQYSSSTHTIDVRTGNGGAQDSGVNISATTNLSAGATYTASVLVRNTNGTNQTFCLSSQGNVVNGNNRSCTWINAGSSATITIQFTTTASGRTAVYLLRTVTAPVSFSFSHVGIYETSKYNTMRSAGISWFDGDGNAE